MSIATKAPADAPCAPRADLTGKRDGLASRLMSLPSCHRCLCGAVLCALPGMALTLDLALPGNGSLTREIVRNPDSYQLPVGPWENGILPTLAIEGRVVQQAWRMEADGVTTLQLMRPILSQLTEAGFRVLFECAGDACGGFDFRFGTRVMAAPDMFVDLFDYRFLSARSDIGEHVSVFVSRSGRIGYVQIIHVSPEATPPPKVNAESGVRPSPRPDLGTAPGAAPGTTNGTRPGTGTPAAADTQPSIARALTTHGHVILGDLEFASASSDLGPGPYATLEALSAWLRADPTRRVALVGHTDTVGGLAPNIALSKRRATSVMRRLIDDHGVSSAQLEAEGMGYLSPVAPNLTPAGREANRRVEAVLLNSE